MTIASTRADFVLACGPRAAEWLARHPDLRRLDTGDDDLHLYASGEVPSGQHPSGRRWAAIADLISGRLEDAASADQSVPQRHWRGRFAFAAWQPGADEIRIFTDHFASLPLYWYQRDGHFAVATDLRLLLDAPGVRRAADPSAVYHFLNFTCIPAPLTICRDIRRVEPGTVLTLGLSSQHSTRYYVPEYPADLHGSDTELATELRDRIQATVHDFRPQTDSDWGCFLSGGTDSSSIVSILSRQGGSQVHTCSIGFHEAGYDELDFARIAGEACGAKPHLARIDRKQALDLLDSVIDAYDQPFANASAIPTLGCAELGQTHGFGLMLGGDGGDEIFGGNERYAKDKVMESFYRLPGPLKQAARAVGNVLGGGHVHVLNRVRNFTRRASLPNPDRFYTDDSFASDFYEELLTPEFRAQVPQDASLEFMRGVFSTGPRTEPLHQIMRLDLLMAIAQNDLVKVHRACKWHGVSVRFPYLDQDLVDYCGRLASHYKVRGLKKRYLFKQAMDGILPVEILRKRKQGFGLPIAVWMKEDPALQARVREVLLDARTLERGWINQEFVTRLINLHMAGGWDYSNALWQLLVLELWLRRYMDAA
ncbi:hypothetical protein CSC70_10045 [Pseudoxanthomonas kalamensis DSM 18571]|uniref:asparagine synthetase B family protein n=1 Tax=Pseudoxanthomonas kalamensis TaxID=289483 RepID=UPI001390DE79|nr:asparagine synthase C-terminal domain-containing protein [Pseudoxanthomonas kalamensis]KAF1710005.1 hypothetical protein CSC70_10045 [Pseudoxanthomonas kalamensis DSM 18571]